MRYGIANLTVLAAFITLFGMTYQGESGQAPQNTRAQATSAASKLSLSKQNNMTLTECQAIHDRLRKQKNDESLRKGFWRMQKSQKDCPFFTPRDYQAMASYSE